MDGAGANTGSSKSPRKRRRPGSPNSPLDEEAVSFRPRQFDPAEHSAAHWRILTTRIVLVERVRRQGQVVSVHLWNPLSRMLALWKVFCLLREYPSFTSVRKLVGVVAKTGVFSLRVTRNQEALRNVPGRKPSCAVRQVASTTSP